jgi:hypothetical protein
VASVSLDENSSAPILDAICPDASVASRFVRTTTAAQLSGKIEFCAVRPEISPP